MRATIAGQTNPGDLDLLDFIPALNARYERPEHLAQLADVFRRIDAGEKVQVLVSYPPQHGKSDLLVNGVARLLRRKPWLRNAYVCYGDALVKKKARQCRDTAIAAGVRLRDDSHAVNDWQTVEGGGLFATGVGGPLTGNPVDGLLIVDDPHKDRADAESALSRGNVQEWWSSTALPRVHPTASKLISHTRWHGDDLIGWLSKETRPGPDGEPVPAWEVINVPAMNDLGEPLWHLRPLSFLAEQRRASEYDWWSLWMGRPRPKGEAVFHKATYYDALPATYRIGKGTDFAYTAKTRADYSCALVLLEGGKNDKGLPLYYVAEVERAQCEVPVFVAKLAALNEKYLGAWHWFCSTTEKGVAQVVSDGESGVVIDPVLATADKFVRAQAVAAAWNDGRVLVPRNAPWLKAFVDELGAFTGVGDRHDDQCVAAGTLVDTEDGSRAIETIEAGDRVWTRDGLRLVKAARQTNPSATVFDVTMNDGRVLVATANHPVFVVDRGFIRVDALTCGDEVVLRSLSAGKHIRHTFQGEPGSALNSAASSIASQRESLPTHSRARIAVLDSDRTGPSRNAARARVATVCVRADRRPVHNLSVDGSHEYFANGVLVHNCDALASAFASLKAVTGLPASAFTQPRAIPLDQLPAGLDGLGSTLVSDELRRWAGGYGGSGM